MRHNLKRYRATRKFADGSEITREIGAWSDDELEELQENWRRSGWVMTVQEVSRLTSRTDISPHGFAPLSTEKIEFPEFTDDLDFFDAVDVIDD